jgi:autotransporter adhesin
VGQLEAGIASTTQGNVRYDTNSDGSTNYGSVTLGNGNSSGTTIHNVAAGTATTDAANVGQLNAGIQQAQNWAQNYTDQRYNQLHGEIQNVGNRANAGIAAGMAMAGLPQAYEPGRSMAAVSAGTFRGESSIAIGVSTISQGGRWVYKLTGSADTRGDAGFSIGAGMQW